jgi:serine protease
MREALGRPPQATKERKRATMKITLALAQAIVLVGCCLTASADVYRVPDDYATIAAAMAAASHGDTVLVAPGTYHEIVRIEKFLSLIGEAGPEQTIIDADGAYDNVVRIHGGLMGQGDHFLVEGFTITNGHDGVGIIPDVMIWRTILRNCIVCENSGNGILIAAGVATIEGCVIADNAGQGIQLSEFNAPPAYLTIIRGNLIVNNGYDAFNAYLDYSGFELTHNTVVGNGLGIRVARWYLGAPLTISSNIIAQNDLYGLRVDQDTPPYDCREIRYNDVWGHEDDVWPLCDCAGLVIGYNGNISADPLFCAPGANDLTLSQDSPCVATGEGGTDMGALGVACGPQSYVPGASQLETTWGAVKALYK